ncbi:MAG: nucleotide exchange factor GrpE, partial [Clostridia bacterium]|nr:nucleotide exchange factor GrpE [Clostridia bacterium]
MSFKKEEEKKHCHCHEEGHECHCHEEDHECHCNEEGHECHCHDNECTCNNEDGHCTDDCNCGGECDCDDCTCGEKTDVALEYLNMAKIIQADFDNYRKRSIESIKRAKQDGVISAVECILPCLDVFKSAKEMLKDESSLKGIEMVE